jgi:hypothetical protein
MTALLRGRLRAMHGGRAESDPLQKLVLLAELRTVTALSKR